jgi:hypothetical protein
MRATFTPKLRIPPKPITDAELREIERSTVLLAEMRASALGDTAENVLGTAFDVAASSGETPFEVLKNRKWVKGEY